MIGSDKREKISSVGYPLITRGFPSMVITACIASIRREPNNLAQASLVNRWSAPSTIHLLGAEKDPGTERKPVPPFCHSHSRWTIASTDAISDLSCLPMNSFVLGEFATPTCLPL
jgi:hypothetical protein